MKRIWGSLAVLLVCMAIAVTASAREVKEETTIKQQGNTIMGKTVTTYESGVLTDKGYLVKDVVKFKEMKNESGANYVYVTKGKDVYKLKFVGDDIKQNMLKVDKDKPIVIYSTHPLTAQEWAMYNTLHLIEQ